MGLGGWGWGWDKSLLPPNLLDRFFNTRWVNIGLIRTGARREQGQRDHIAHASTRHHTPARRRPVESECIVGIRSAIKRVRTLTLAPPDVSITEHTGDAASGSLNHPTTPPYILHRRAAAYASLAARMHTRTLPRTADSVQLSALGSRVWALGSDSCRGYRVQGTAWALGPPCAEGAGYRVPPGLSARPRAEGAGYSLGPGRVRYRVWFQQTAGTSGGAALVNRHLGQQVW